MTSCSSIKQQLLWYVYPIFYPCNHNGSMQQRKFTAIYLWLLQMCHSTAANQTQKITHSESQSLFCLQIMWNPLLLCSPPYSQGTRPEQWMWTHRASVCWIQCGWQIILAWEEIIRAVTVLYSMTDYEALLRIYNTQSVYEYETGSYMTNLSVNSLTHFEVSTNSLVLTGAWKSDSSLPLNELFKV